MFVRLLPLIVAFPDSFAVDPTFTARFQVPYNSRLEVRVAKEAFVQEITGLGEFVLAREHRLGAAQPAITGQTQASMTREHGNY